MSYKLDTSMKNIVIFASGSGSNAENIIRFFKKSTIASVIKVFSNNPSAGVLQRAESCGISSIVFNRSDFVSGGLVQNILDELSPDLIVLAGFLWKFPEFLIQAFPKKIINIHPSLLPKYGGKGMYGKRVHEAVVNNKETKSGISIHFVNENYDDGALIYQKSCTVDKADTALRLAQKIHELEMAHFPTVVEKLLND